MLCFDRFGKVPYSANRKMDNILTRASVAVKYVDSHIQFSLPIPVRYGHYEEYAVWFPGGVSQQVKDTIRSNLGVGR